ncbi:MAG: class I SAM-dependent methyltransferase [Thermoplasmata archaeon]
MPSAAPRTHPDVRGFERAAEVYERARPEYPATAVRHLGRVLRLGPSRTIVDLGSGTGKFTRALAALRAARVAVEPTGGMRAVFKRMVPDVPVLDGTAEAMPLPDGFADAVVSAQAFHWFRVRPALREVRRVLRPGGGVGLVWNTRDDSVRWSRQLTEIVETAGRSRRPWRERTAGSYWRTVLRPAFSRKGSGFTSLRYRAFRQVQCGTPAMFVDRALSVSKIAVLPLRERRAVATAVRELLAADPETRGRSRIRLPYRTDVYWAYAR